MRKGYALLLILLILGLFTPVASAGEKPLVVASIGPITSIVEEAFGNSVEVVTLIPLGADPHEYQLSAEQINLLQRADVIVTTGGHLPVEAKMAQLKEEGVINAEILLIDDFKAKGFHYLPERWYGGKDNPHGTWLDPDNALAIASATESALEKVDPANAETYRRDLDLFRARVTAIKEAFSGFAANRSAVINMPPVQYAVEWLGIKAVASIKPEEEVPAKGVDELVPVAERSDVVVYSLQSPVQLQEAAIELAEKSGKPVAGVVVFWEGKPYTEVLRENAVSVLKALGEKRVEVEKKGNGYSLAYVLSALFAGLSLGTALGYALKG
ncbi:metal ABC transporter solute-binding protein, Zn/Mn family [Thermococcus sp. AM4]|uniref:metal ABC transporter solute-binding protein, Zn/Mn family n=1 Tax=Thermococcus sp. (strain AM4) TaxID=246969 RepID=UPI0001870965|nr:zinc ABC transporter substrate-binding protein [Thermococcus sp. AM4]EEB74110.1 ABC-type manganese/zinc transporter, periplasmic binding protein [Thermococcus sp. AM4]